MSDKSKPPFPFESSLARLEQILEQMNTGNVSLDESLSLYEEADSIIASCSARLNEAEQKIETLVKNRQGEVAMSAESAPSPLMSEFYIPV